MDNVGLGWFFMFNLTKMPENSQNMNVKRKNSIFLTFWGTPGGSVETPEI
jgi:hypothetical protein